MRFLPLLFLICVQAAWADEPAAPPVAAKPAISATPLSGRFVAVGQTQTLNGSEFEFFALAGYSGEVTWDVTSDDEKMPVKWFECAPKTKVIGYRAGRTEPAEYESPDGPSVAVWSVGTGKAVISAWGLKEGSKKPFKITTMLIEANRGPRPPPKPVDPVTPVDPVVPDPVNPDPIDITPLPVPGFRMLIVEETGQRPVLPADQRAIFTSSALRAFVRENCAKGVDGKTPEFRILDQDQKMDKESKVWQDAMGRALQDSRDAAEEARLAAKAAGKTGTLPTIILPWVLVSNGVTGYSGPLPKNIDETLALSIKYVKPPKK